MVHEIRYPGIHREGYGGMTDRGGVVRDARVFDLTSESETRRGWTRSRFDKLYGEVRAAWESHGRVAGSLSSDLRVRDERICAESIRPARDLGWSPDPDREDELGRSLMYRPT